MALFDRKAIASVCTNWLTWFLLNTMELQPTLNGKTSDSHYVITYQLGRLASSFYKAPIFKKDTSIRVLGRHIIPSFLRRDSVQIASGG